MRIGFVLGLGLAISTVSGALHAQGFGGSAGPAEVPPSSYTSAQYVDSQGCIFIRAGRGGVVRWVPRVTRSRKQMCGYQPSVAATQPAANVVPSATVAATQPLVTAPARTVIAAQPVVQTRGFYRTGVPAQVGAVAPRQVVVQTQQQTRQGRGLYNNGSYTQAPIGIVTCGYGNGVYNSPSGGRFDVRCRPQLTSPVYGSTRTGNRRFDDQPAVRIVRVPAPQFTAPPGYQPVWEDGRLNPIRGIGTLEGQIRSRLIWTDTTPSRLVHKETNRQRTYRLPGVAYPYGAYQQMYQHNGFYYSR